MVGHVESYSTSSCLGGNDIALLGPVASFNHWLQFLFPVFAKPDKEEGE